MSQLLKAVNEQAGDLSNMEILNQLASVLDKHREVSIQEATYRILSLPMTKSSIKVKYLSTIHPHFRDGLLKGDVEELEDGESIFHHSAHEYYSNRELCCIDGIQYTEDEMLENYWTELYLADFWSYYEIVYGKGKANDDKKKNHIPLKNGVGYIKRRTNRCVLKYHLNFENDEDFKRGLLILFVPFQNELKDIHEKDVNTLYADNEDIIKERRAIFEKHKVMTDIIDSIERNIKDKNEDNLEDQEEDGFIEEETTTVEELDNFEKWAKKEAKKSLMKYKDLTTLIKVEDLRNIVIKLNEQQRKILDDYCERLK